MIVDVLRSDGRRETSRAVDDKSVVEHPHKDVRSTQAVRPVNASVNDHFVPCLFGVLGDGKNFPSASRRANARIWVWMNAFAWVMMRGTVPVMEWFVTTLRSLPV